MTNIVIPKKKMLKEHKELIPILKKGSKAQRIKEANKQAKEMKKYK